MGITEIILVLISLLIVVGLSILVLKIFNKKISFWKIFGISILLLILFNLISKLLQ